MTSKQQVIKNKEEIKFKGIFELIREAFKLYQSRINNFLRLAVIWIIIAAIGFFLTFSSFLFGGFYQPIIFFFGAILVVIASLVINPALVYITKEKIKAEEAIKKALKILLSYVWVAFLVGLAVLGGYMLLIVPGIIFAVWFSLAIYILIFEEKKGTKALLRSKQLVQGRWWSVLWKFLGFGLLIMAASYAVFIPAGIVSMIISTLSKFLGSIMGNITMIIMSFLFGVVMFIIQFFITSFGIVYGVLVYKNLKEIKEEKPKETELITP